MGNESSNPAWPNLRSFCRDCLESACSLATAAEINRCRFVVEQRSRDRERLRRGQPPRLRDRAKIQTRTVRTPDDLEDAEFHA